MQKTAIHIFRPGRHTAMQGAVVEFGEAELAATAAAYDPARHEAPLVIGHPAADAPAWGWVKGLAAEAAGLFATPRQLDPAFAEMVRAGRFKKVSASFYALDNPNTPAPGVYYLRHVGFLGAQPPAVKGLAPVNFSEADTGEDCITIEFAESPGLLRRLADLFRGLREYIVEKDGAEAADRTVPSWAVSAMQEEAVQAAAQVVDIPAFAEGGPEKEKEHSVKKDNPDTPAAQPEQGQQPDPAFAEARTRASELEKKVASLLSEARQGRARAVVESALADGRLTPAQSAGLVEFMAGLEEEQTFDFAEGEKTVSVSPVAFMTAFLARLPKQVDFSEAAPAGGEDSPATSADLARRALSYCEEMRGKGVTVSITDAVAHVSAGKE